MRREINNYWFDILFFDEENESFSRKIRKTEGGPDLV